MSSLSIEQLLQGLVEERAFDLRAYKRSTLERRIGKRMGEIAIRDYAGYLEYVRNNPEEVNTLLSTVLINITEFFRDPQAWEYLRQKALPDLLAHCKPGDSFRGWCAGCASGEEVYSLAILLAEHFGDRIGDYDIRIYATDIDDEALNLARRAEYSADKLRRVRSEWRDKYFHAAHSHYRVNREIRRMVIFGRSNLSSDAPISHVNLIICRNVLIYFGPDAQRQILRRLHYALEKSGIVFFGKAESQLTNSRLFAPLHSRWRIFRRAENNEDQAPRRREREAPMKRDDSNGREELEVLQLQQKYLFQTLGSGVITLDPQDVVTSMNEFAASAWGVSANEVVGKRLHQSELGRRHPELVESLESTRSGSEAHLRAPIQKDSEEHILAVVLKPMMLNGDRKGTLIHCEDVTHREKLQVTIGQLESTGEELQSANEELETTNEELQSTNEELETTNEELQSTNEELETTNEELQSLNEELENMNEELELRTRELDSVNLRYSDTLERMPWPVMVVDGESNFQFWNSAAQRLFQIAARSVVGVQMALVPIEAELRKTLIRGTQKARTSQKAVMLRQESDAKTELNNMEIRFEPLSGESAQKAVLIMIGPFFNAQGISSGSRSSNSKPRSYSRSKKKKNK